MHNFLYYFTGSLCWLLECVHIRKLAFQAMLSVSFLLSFNDLSLDKKSRALGAWSEIPTLPLAQAEWWTRAYQAPFCLLLSTSNFPTLALAHHARGRWQQVRWGKLLSWQNTVPECLEFEYQDSAKREINSSLEWVTNRFKTRHVAKWKCSGCLGWCLINLLSYGVVRQKRREIGWPLGLFQDISAFYHSAARVNVIRAVMSWPAPDMNRVWLIICIVH